MFDLLEFTVISCTALVCVGLAVWWTNPRTPRAEPTDWIDPDPLALLFQNGMLHHATDQARALLSLEPGTHFWDDLRDQLLTRFPDFPANPGTGLQGHTTLQALDRCGLDQAEITWQGPRCRVLLQDLSAPPHAPEISAEQAELQILRRIRDSAPDPVWQEDESGTISWYNKAYENLYFQAHGSRVDPGRSLFSESDCKHPNRVILNNGKRERPDWYQLATVQTDDVTVYHATCINAVTVAEDTQRNFVQTLAKTFAHLSIGLAIFDRDGQLTIFNPALVDLTGLPAHFLSARPTMLSFFDQLRENRRMPEPKNYHNWREEIASVIAAATDGRYQETWTLESGQTYNVKGRPHPDGATAFLIEDISAEMTLTRNFRAELEQGQVLLDTVDEAMVVFSPTGVLTFCNASYRDMWSVDPDSSFADVLIRDSVAIWQERFGASRVWNSIEEFVTEFGERQAWNIPVGHVDGAPLRCYLVPLPSGSTLVQFRQHAAAFDPDTKPRRLIVG